MAESAFVRMNLPDRSYQAAVRSEIRRLAESAGFTGHRLGEVEIIVAEMTSNLVKHATRGGFLLARPIKDGNSGIELIAIDAGPGMNIPTEMLEDGRSTTKTLGHGLGAIKRLSSEFDIYSLRGWGMVLFAKAYVSKTQARKPADVFEVVGINVCKPGETVSGDGWKFVQQGRKIYGLVVDGLGHGEAANKATQQAIKAFLAMPGLLPVDQLHAIHRSLKGTRGAVVNVMHVDRANYELSYSGVGNISMKIISYPLSKGCYSYNGIVGHIMPAVLKNHVLPWQATDMFIVHSDGISARWDLQKYPGILQHHPLMVCAALYKDNNRGTDDATIVVGKMTKEPR